MLKDLFIINKYGIGIAEYHATNNEFELQLIAGLLSALIDFSKNTLLDTMQIIKLEHGKLVITTTEATEVFAIGIYDEEDHDVAIKRANSKIFQDFTNKHTILKEYESVEYDPTPALKQYKLPITIKKNWQHTLVVGIIASLALTPLYFTNDLFANVIQYGINSDINYLALYIGFAIPYFLIGLFVGKRMHAALLGLMMNTVFSSLLLLQILNRINFAYTQIPFDGLDLTYGVAMVAGFFGGYLSEFIFLKK